MFEVETPPRAAKSRRRAPWRRAVSRRSWCTEVSVKQTRTVRVFRGFWRFGVEKTFRGETAEDWPVKRPVPVKTALGSVGRAQLAETPRLARTARREDWPVTERLLQKRRRARCAARRAC